MNFSRDTGPVAPRPRGLGWHRPRHHGHFPGPFWPLPDRYLRESGQEGHHAIRHRPHGTISSWGLA
ncbi:hypothetical protein POX_f07466 [Penicillium oxalicum]|uniref:Uncharacterized protein n=1 Tax=Penicillium oxalicum (strain 114-2 / CGMCC 5302) TaxID=933388 RepID=S7ZI74_PENO1|nr:hypothetical protein POX_f07466 [Penicillium oxalicum]EPS28381.1 hypothetical protein PDE_03327 [Penicillium oxalicum 114-2]KAI2787107.1 hypothetical protein POX_f07466 [Penicillium oxalicum]